MCYSAVDLSKYIVYKCITEGQPISNLQLQKILYYIQREFLKNDRIAFADDIQAWQFGPVVPNVYYTFCGFGAMPISVSNKPAIEMNEQDRRTVDQIVESKRDLRPWDLVKETHKSDGAWAETYQDGKGNYSVISKERIKQIG